jgi:hypothetical protein
LNGSLIPIEPSSLVGSFDVSDSQKDRKNFSLKPNITGNILLEKKKRGYVVHKRDTNQYKSLEEMIGHQKSGLGQKMYTKVDLLHRGAENKPDLSDGGSLRSSVAENLLAERPSFPLPKSKVEMTPSKRNDSNIVNLDKLVSNNSLNLKNLD